MNKSYAKSLLHNAPLILLCITLSLLLWNKASLKAEHPLLACKAACVPLMYEIIDEECWCRVNENTLKLQTNK